MPSWAASWTLQGSGQIYDVHRLSPKNSLISMDSNTSIGLGSSSSHLRAKGDARTLKFLHLHKTAGTSVRSFLERFFRPEEICPAGFRHQFQALSSDQLRRYRMFAGHLDWEELDQVEGPSFTFTVLREPRERLLSYYFFMRAEAVRMAR